MYLLIDIGNSRLKWNLYDPEKSRFLASARGESWDNNNLSQLINDCWTALPTISAALVASVAGDHADSVIAQWLHNHAAVNAEFIRSPRQAFGVTNAYENPPQLGVDRWLAMVAATRLAPSQPVCVVDCGTAITIDSVDGNGGHLGGTIIPGRAAMRTVLARAPGVALSHQLSQRNMFGKNTNDGLNNGIFYAVVAYINFAAGEIEKSLQQPVYKIITGGDANNIQPHLMHSFRHEPDLVLQGLALYAH
jgi:type III pantothenate kinase